MPTLKVPISFSDHILGPESAELTLLEYGDFECVDCGQAYPVVKDVQEHFGENLRFAFRNFPLTHTHAHAETAAQAAEFAATHGKFWEMHDLLFENQDDLTPAALIRYAETLELPGADLRRALESRTFRQRVRDDFTGGVRSGVSGTPTFFINGRRHEGAFDFDILVDALALARAA